MKFIPRANDLLALPKMQKVKRKIRSTKPEAILQRQCESYLEHNRLEFLHIPNSMWASLFHYKSYGTLNECSDYLKGWPDLLICKDGRYLAIELKTETGKLLMSQKWKKRTLGTIVCRSFEEFETTVKEWDK